MKENGNHLRFSDHIFCRKISEAILSPLLLSRAHGRVHMRYVFVYTQRPTSIYTCLPNMHIKDFCFAAWILDMPEACSFSTWTELGLWACHGVYIKQPACLGRGLLVSVSLASSINQVTLLTCVGGHSGSLQSRVMAGSAQPISCLWKMILSSKPITGRRLCYIHTGAAQFPSLLSLLYKAQK